MVSQVPAIAGKLTNDNRHIVRLRLIAGDCGCSGKRRARVECVLSVDILASRARGGSVLPPSRR